MREPSILIVRAFNVVTPVEEISAGLVYQSIAPANEEGFCFTNVKFEPFVTLIVSAFTVAPSTTAFTELKFNDPATALESRFANAITPSAVYAAFSPPITFATAVYIL